MKEGYRALVTKIKYQTPKGHYGVSSLQDSLEKRVPIDLDHLPLEHRSHDRLTEMGEDANILYRFFSYFVSNIEPDCGPTLPETNCKGYNISGKGPVRLCLDGHTVPR